jgi:hypothetical protein
MKTAHPDKTPTTRSPMQWAFAIIVAAAGIMVVGFLILLAIYVFFA